jgi:hypothetical protein
MPVDARASGGLGDTRFSRFGRPLVHLLLALLRLAGGLRCGRLLAGLGELRETQIFIGQFFIGIVQIIILRRSLPNHAPIGDANRRGTRLSGSR